MTPQKHLRVFPWHEIPSYQVTPISIFLIALCFVALPKGMLAGNGNTGRTEIQRNFEDYLYQGKYDSAMVVNDYYQELYLVTEDSNYYARYATNLGEVYYYQSLFVEALAYFSEALLFVDHQLDPILTGQLYNHLCACSQKTGDYKNAFLYCQRAMTEWSGLDDQEGIAKSMTLMADQYLKMGYIDSAIATLKKSIQLSAANGFLIQDAEAKVMLGKAYLIDNSPDSALYYSKASIPLFEEKGFLHGIASAQRQMGKAYLQQNRLHAAADMFEQAITLYKQLGVAKCQMMTQLHLAKSYLMMDFLQKAELMVDSSELLLQSIPLTHYQQLEQLYDVKYQLAYAKGDSLNGHKYFQSFVLYRDSLLAAEDKSQLMELKLSHDIARKDATIVRLNETYARVKTRGRLYLFIGLAISLALIFIIISMKKKMATVETGRSQLVQDLDLMQQNYLISGGKDLTVHKLEKEKITAQIGATLNDTDWNLLQALIENPNASNKLIASQISISHEGVRSSLKKMYKLFQIEDNVANKKLALTLAAVAASN